MMMDRSECEHGDELSACPVAPVAWREPTHCSGGSARGEEGRRAAAAATWHKAGRRAVAVAVTRREAGHGEAVMWRESERGDVARVTRMEELTWMAKPVKTTGGIYVNGFVK